MTTPESLPFLSAERIREAVPMPRLLDAVEAAYRDVVAGRDRSPLRSHVELGDGSLLLMPGIREGGDGATVKLVTVMPNNARRGLPTIHALVVWFESETGRALALLDGATVTAMRTGAASGVGTRLLARQDSETLTVIGAGVQAEWQIRAVLAARPIRRVLVVGRDATRRDAFASRMADALGIDVAAAADAERAVRDADVICCATTSSTPVFDAEWLAPGAHVNGIGAFQLSMVEIPPEALGRASLVAVDSRDAALAEAGDVVAAIEAGLVGVDALVEIGSVEPSWAANRPPDAITIFKSVGLAIQDVAAAELIVASLGGAPSS
ncbi:MAG: ornithine cyclodeaminase family protein [Chloroflexi bacterium]|nr:ornithine cyclodeaminase family protein [Chloroflexota bacterium]